MTPYRLLIDYGFSAVKALEISVDYVRGKERAIEIVKTIKASYHEQTNIINTRRIANVMPAKQD